MKPKALIKDDFRNLLEYQHWVNESFNNLSPLNSFQYERFGKEKTEKIIRMGWYGDDVTFAELKEGVKQYKRPDLLEELYNKVSHEIEQVLVQKLKARKMKFNALGFGMFSFDRAALTMFRNPEYYSASKKSKVDFSEVKETKNGFTHKKDGSKIVKRWEEKPDGSPKIRTNTKELFAYFPEVPRDRHSVEIFLAGGGASKVKPEALLYAGVSAVIISELLIKAGFRIKINMVIGSADSDSRNKFVGCVIPVKQYDETLDRNIIALLSSDPRFFRYDGLKGIVSAYDHFNLKVGTGLGYPMSASELKELFENSGYTKNLQSAHRYYFGGTFTEEEAISDIKETIEDIVNKLKK